MNFEGITHPQLAVRSSHELEGETFFHLDLKCVGDQSLLIQRRYLIDRFGSRKTEVLTHCLDRHATRRNQLQTIL
jgi:hypothetical protein